jgi:septum formation protein
MKLILASRSPRRAEILRAAGITFEVQPAQVIEQRAGQESPEAMVKRLAMAKAEMVATALVEMQRTADRSPRAAHAIVLGADTVVVLDGKIFGQPRSAKRARQMLRELRGREHEVITAAAAILLQPPELRLDHRLCGLERTRVWMSELTDRELEDYLASGEPLDKAGAYAIQGRAAKFIPRIEGCYFNVVGLPMARVYRMLRQLGFDAGGARDERQTGAARKKI